MGFKGWYRHCMKYPGVRQLVWPLLMYVFVHGQHVHSTHVFFSLVNVSLKPQEIRVRIPNVFIVCLCLFIAHALPWLLHPPKDANCWCMCVPDCESVYIYVIVYRYIYICTIRVYVYIYTLHIHIYIYIYSYACVCVCLWVSMYV